MYPARGVIGELLSGENNSRQIDAADGRDRWSMAAHQGAGMTAPAGVDRPAGQGHSGSRDGFDAAARSHGDKSAFDPPAAAADPPAGAARRAGLVVLLPAILGLLLLAAAVMMPAGHAAFALPALAGAAALGMLALFQGWQWHRRRLWCGTRAQQVARVMRNDPDPLILSDRDGRRLAGNAAARALTLEQVLARLCAEPGRVIAEMIDEVVRRGHAERVFHGHASVLRAGVHCLQGKEAALGGQAVLVWRFRAEASSPAHRPIDMLGLPVLTLGAEGAPARANAVLGALLAQGSKGARAALDELAHDLRALAANRRPASIILPDRTTARYALPLPAADGQVDVMLLPVGLLPRADAAGMPTQPDFEDIPVALMHITPDGRVLRSNRQARWLLGLPASRKAFFSDLVEGLGRPVEDWLADAVAGRALNRPEVLRATLPAQETFVQVILRRAPPPDDSLVAVVSDATELKSLEARFVQSQKMQAIGQLAGGVAHDFNNLLTAISGHCDLLLMNRDHYDSDYSDLMQIHQNANRAAALVRQLLAFSRKQTLKPEWLALESLLEDLAHLLARLVGERITLTLDHDRHLKQIRTDRRQLEQIILNLVVNARDAMPMGGEIRIETEAVVLEDELERGRVRLPAGHYAVIRVIDEGIGIPADIIDKIFEPFFTTKKLGEGTGLGLSTAYGIVKQMGGYIFADSTEGTGTVFTLYFAMPAAAAERGIDDEAALAQQRARPADAAGATETIPVHAATSLTASVRDGEHDEACAFAGGAESPVVVEGAQAAPRTAKTMNRGDGARPGTTGNTAMAAPDSRGVDAVVLLVEDEAPVRAFAARALRLHGYQVIEAESGEQALEFLAEPALRVDVFVSDVVMPGLDGPGWVNRARKARPDVPVVFMSGHTEDNLHAALARTPGAAFLDKPFALQALCQTIDQQLKINPPRATEDRAT